MARRAHDAYMTPEHYVAQIGPYLSRGQFLEPCVGDGAILKFLPAGTITNDLDEKHDADFHRDARLFSSWAVWYNSGFCWDWVITNPPFKHAFPIVQNAVEHSRNVAMLLRISFFEPTRERGPWLTANPPRRLIYLPRYSFTGNGKSDSTTCCWALWGPDVPSGIEIAPRFPE